MCQDYVLHYKTFPDSYINPILSCMTIEILQMGEIKPMDFILIQTSYPKDSLFVEDSSTRQLIFDIKGSTSQRQSLKRPNELLNLESLLKEQQKENYKDLDFLLSYRTLEFDLDVFTVVQQQLLDDTTFLTRMNLHDYSLLLYLKVYLLYNSNKYQNMERDSIPSRIPPTYKTEICSLKEAADTPTSHWLRDKKSLIHRHCLFGNKVICLCTSLPLVKKASGFVHFRIKSTHWAIEYHINNSQNAADIQRILGRRRKESRRGMKGSNEKDFGEYSGALDGSISIAPSIESEASFEQINIDKTIEEENFDFTTFPKLSNFKIFNIHKVRFVQQFPLECDICDECNHCYIILSDWGIAQEQVNI